MNNWICLDLETQYSAEDCIHCGGDILTHMPITGQCGPAMVTTFSKIGWDRKTELGLSVGCYWSAMDGRIYWFDTDTLMPVMEMLVASQPLMVSFNGIQFDFSLMRGILRRRAETLPGFEGEYLVKVCDAFKVLAARSYDVLAEIWKIDQANKFERGLNSLDSIAQANGLGAKSGSGAEAPRDWAAGRWAKVLNYCSRDVYLTKDLFELAWTGQPIKRRGGKDITLPLPIFPGAQL
jgi:hypothetical protein